MGQKAYFCSVKKQTKAIHTPYRLRDPYGALAMPVYHTAAYEFDTAQDMADAFTGKVMMPDYSRVMNPTVTHFEDRVRHLTDAADVIAFNAGMAAITNTLLALAAAGRSIVTSSHLFGNTFSLIASTLARFGVRPVMCDLTDIAAVEQAVDDKACCLFLEIVTNPQMEVADLKALAGVTRSHGIPLIADTTAIPFTCFSARESGVDIEIVSSTKYLSGGGTSLGGLVIDYGTTEGFGRRMRNEMLFNIGGYMTPQVAYMQTLGLETLDARYRVQAANAMELATRLEALTAHSSSLCSVNYVGLPTNRFNAIATAQFGGTYGAMLTIDLDSEASCYRFIDSLRLIHRATNLFDSRSLAIHPASTIFGNFSPRARRRMDVLDTTIRLSIGLEDVDDLYDDISQALP